MITLSRLLGATLAAVCCLLSATAAMAQSATGACCLPNGTCVQLSQCECEMQGGGFAGAGTSCVGLNCQPLVFGACCTNTGCTNTIQSICNAIPGSFLAGQACPVAVCPPGGFACCCGPVCFVVDRTFCSHQGGVSLPATTCNPNPCPGACCDLAGNCTLVGGPAACQGQFLGNGVSCNPNPCPGACCDTFGNCTQTTLSACQGSFLVGTCTPNPCPQKVCCDPQTGNCQVVQPCPAGWTPAIGPCTPTLCPVPQFNGVCCDVLGNCIPWVAGTVCNGQIITTTTSCNPNPCVPHVCCDPQTGVCQTVTPCPTGWTQVTGPCAPTNPCPPSQGVCCDQQNNCFPLANGATCNGTIFPNQTSCTPNPCPQMACCTASGACIPVSNSAQCNGQLFPNISSCTPNPCSQTVCCDPASGQCQAITPCPTGWISVTGPCSPAVACGPSGVCCTTTGQCIPIVSGVQCNGTIFPNLTSCTPNPCVPNGACCQPCSGACSTTTAAGCPSPNTFFPGAACQPGVCPTTPVFGQCCLNRVCITATSCDCILKGGTFSGTVPCNPQLCANDGPGACCHSNVCTVMSAQTCAQVGGTSAIGVSCAAAFPNCTGPVSVCCCCGLCHILDAQACTLAGGTVGTGTTCTALSCYPSGGACCDPTNGQCFVVANSTQCAAPLIFFAGQPCTPPGCVPTGSCCNVCTGTCTVTQPQQCIGPFDVYTPGGTCQPPQICLPTCGACCTVNTAGQIICTIVASQTACNGTWMGIGSTCNPNPCIPPSVTCCNAQSGACQTFGGTTNCPAGWFGNFSSCSPNPCPLGACCTLGSINCTQTTQQGCNGFWQANVSCNPNPCVRICCNTSTGACFAAGFGNPCPTGSVGITATTCSPNPCPPVSACCILGTIICTTTTQANCANLPGLWIPSTACNPNPCVKACCNPNTGACFQIFGGNSCPAGATPVITGVTCTPNPCPPVAPCCLQGGGGCIITTQANCLSGPFPGIWGPVGGSCNIVCSVACCNFNTGQCIASTVFGVCPPGFTGIPNSTCNPSPCPPTGRCCTFPSGCTVTTQANCNGIWGPAGSTCTTNPCTHVCCNTQTGACITAPIYAFCFGPWTNLGNATCTPNPCPPVTKPCCLPSGACVLVTQIQCLGAGGQIMTPATTCTSSLCLGACCLPPNAVVCNVSQGTHCVITTQANCQGTWKGYGTACAAPPTSSNFTTCCRANFNGSNGVNINDIFDFLTAWFSGCIGQPGAPCFGASADFNCDGQVNIADIFAFLNAWFIGCS